MKNDAGQRVWKKIDVGNRQRRHFDQRAKSVTLPPTLHPKEANRVCFVEVNRDSPARDLAQDPTLGAGLRSAEKYVLLNIRFFLDRSIAAF